MFGCNLASFFVSPFVQLHKEMIREDGSLGRDKNQDTGDEPSGCFPLGDTATLHLSLHGKVMLGGARVGGAGEQEGRCKKYIDLCI